MVEERIERGDLYSFPGGDKSQFWAAICVYQPFTMGGSVWRWYRFPVQANFIRILGYACFAFEHDGRWHIYHQETGGLILRGKDLKETLDALVLLFDKTDDFDEQVKELGSKMCHPEMELEKALSYLSKNITKERDAEEEEEETPEEVSAEETEG